MKNYTDKKKVKKQEEDYRNKDMKGFIDFIAEDYNNKCIHHQRGDCKKKSCNDCPDWEDYR